MCMRQGVLMNAARSKKLNKYTVLFQNLFLIPSKETFSLFTVSINLLIIFLIYTSIYRLEIVQTNPLKYLTFYVT